MTPERSRKAEEIIAYTKQLLTSGGYRSFSFADISEKVNIRKASIHHHFPSKAELVRAVLEEYRAEGQTGMQTLSRDINNPLAEIQAYADYWTACIKEGSSAFCIGGMLAVELPGLPPEVAEQVTGHFSDIAAWLASVLQRGEREKQIQLRDTLSSEANRLMATIYGAMLTARALNDPELFPQIVQPVINNLVRTD